MIARKPKSFFLVEASDENGTVLWVERCRLLKCAYRMTEKALNSDKTHEIRGISIIEAIRVEGETICLETVECVGHDAEQRKEK